MGQKVKKDMIGMINSDKDAENRYNTYKYEDPYSEISPALLNSDDLRKYVLKTGMIYPFELSEEKSNNDEWVTYPIKIGDTCHYWDESGIKQVIDLTTKEKFSLRKNSIVFVELEPTFRVPYYIVLRFNLKIKHIYKGLLLGTGPIIDPGFNGKIFIPLHNFTNNDYEFRRGEELIEMEFTKISKKEKWNNIAENKNNTRGFDEYINKALEKNIVGNEKRVVNNALPAEIRQQQTKLDNQDGTIKEQDKKIEEQREKLNKEIEESKKFRNVGILAGIMAVISICVSIIGIHISESARYDSLTNQTFELNNEIKKLEQYKEIIDRLEDKMEQLNEKIESNNIKKAETQHIKGESNNGRK